MKQRSAVRSNILRSRVFRSSALCLALTIACVSGNQTSYWDGKVSVHGALRAMFHEGQTESMVTLDNLLPSQNLFGLGAIADLAGEITILGGMTYLAYPEGQNTSRTESVSAPNTGAALLVSAEVGAWRTTTTQQQIHFEDLDREIEQLAAAAGMDTNRPFPFLLEGEFLDLAWHVIDGTRLKDGGKSHEDHLRAAVRQSASRTGATLMGFFSTQHQGVFTHKDSRVHVHCVVDQPLASGHVDGVTIPAGTTLRFPAVAR